MPLVRHDSHRKAENEAGSSKRLAISASGTSVKAVRTTEPQIVWPCMAKTGVIAFMDRSQADKILKSQVYKSSLFRIV